MAGWLALASVVAFVWLAVQQAWSADGSMAAWQLWILAGLAHLGALATLLLRREPAPVAFRQGGAAVEDRANSPNGRAPIPLAEFLDDVSAGISNETAHGLIGTISFADFSSIVHLDEALALELRDKLLERLLVAAARGRRIAQVENSVFAIWFADSGEIEAARTELAALAHALRAELVIGDRSIRPAIEVGTATYPDDGSDARQLLHRALGAIEFGLSREGVRRFSRFEERQALVRFDTRQDIARAIDNYEFELHYQPFVNIASGKVVGGEALVRWRKPDGNLVAPSKFIELVERSDLADRLGTWALNAACADLAAWTAQGHDFRIAVNLSARQLRNPRLAELVKRTAQLHGLAAGRLELELTETAAMEDVELSREAFKRLRQFGVAISIDDFGSGYSSFSYLKSLPFDKLKIDREFVRNVHRSRESQAICGALLALGRGLGVSVIAEGVEAREEVDVLAAMGCALFQGYYFSRPLLADKFASVGEDEQLQNRMLPVPAAKQQPAGSAALG